MNFAAAPVPIGRSTQMTVDSRKSPASARSGHWSIAADTDLPVAAVAKTVGYADPFAFSTAFKRLNGMGPRDFRARAS